MTGSQNQMLGGCGVCLDERGWKENPLVYCDGASCDVAVHKNCYGITKVPSGPWFCQKCSSKEPRHLIRCCLCPRLQGVLKKTDDDRWAHVLCALYIPELSFGNVMTMEPIIVGGMAPSMFNTKVCYICEENQRPDDKQYGVCLMCFRPSCKVVFHVTCAQSRGLLGEEQGSEPDRVQYCGYCGLHAKKTKPTKTNVVGSPSNGQAKQTENSNSAGSSDDKKNFTTPLTVEVTNPPEKAKPRSRARPANNNGAPKPKRTRKPAAKKNPAKAASPEAAAALAKLSPKSPLRSPLRSPGIRSPSLLSPGRSPISLVSSTSAHGLLEQQFELGKKMLKNQAPLDIAQLLTCISQIKQENLQLEAELNELTIRRDHLVSVNAKLALPNTMATSSASNTSATDKYSNNTLPPTVRNGPTHGVNNHVANTSHAARSTAALQHSSTSTIQSSISQTGHTVLTTQTGAQKDSTNKRPNSATNSNREPTSAQARKRAAESVIKMNTKQLKQGPTPPIARGSSQQKLSSMDSGSHFQWPAPITQPSSVSRPTSSSSAPSLDSVGSRLPPIKALSQARLPAHTISSPYLNNAAAAATLASYAGGPAALGSYSYPQFPMFSIGGLPDMASLNQTALSGLAMPGLHSSQQFYRTAADSVTQSVQSNSSIQQ